MPTTIRIFRYLDDLDAFVVTDEYRNLAEALGLIEWHPAVWIGRLFALDNDWGEHWFDNWDLRAERGLSDDHLTIDPERFQDGRDGPCHSADFRRRFWTDVLKSLELSLDLLFDEARQFNQQHQTLLSSDPRLAECGVGHIVDLEDRIAAIWARYAG